MSVHVIVSGDQGADKMIEWIRDRCHNGFVIMISISGSIVLLSGALFVLTYTASKYGRPEDDVNRGKEV